MPVRALIAALALAACGPKPATGPDGPTAGDRRVEVVVIGTLGRAHLASPGYGLAVLKDIIRAVDPDLIAVELPADRLALGLEQHRAGGEVTDERVARFPEITGAVFPLLGELDARVIGYDGWTEEAAAARLDAERALRAERPEEAATIDRAIAEAEAALAAEGLADDPAAIHTRRFDAIVAAGMAPYDELWGEALGEAGWSAQNRDRVERIAAALADRSRGERRVAVLSGAWRKGALRAGLARSPGVVVLDLASLWPP